MSSPAANTSDRPPAGREPPALELLGIDKRFGSVHANRSVSLRVARGTIHGIIGENGAGKSTLMNIVYGFHRADEGEIWIHGRRADIRRSSDAIAAGVGMVHQHFMLVEAFTVLENAILGLEGGALLAEGMQRARAELSQLAADYGLEVPLDVPVGQLSVGVLQRVEILKALYRRADILILDEPTAVLTPREADQLFHLLAKLREQGKTVLLVTHKLREVMAITDRITVMRQGAVVDEVDTRDTSPSRLAEIMVGRVVQLEVSKSASQPGATLLEARNLRVTDRFGVPRVKGLSLSLRAGEIVGIAGVSGNGQAELLEALAGIQMPTQGEIIFGGKDLVREKADPRERRRLGLAHVPEDRLAMGFVSAFSAQDNAILGYHDRPEYQKGPLFNFSAITASCEGKMSAYDVRPADPAQRIGTFSGGNQQKLLLAREIDSDPSVLLIGQPTRGVDIGAIEFIHRRLVELRDSGKALLIVSVELDEILGLADRILVMTDGVIAGEISGAEADEQKVGLLMAGVRMSEVGGRMSEDGAESQRGRRPEDRGQMPEARSQISEVARLRRDSGEVPFGQRVEGGSVGAKGFGFRGGVSRIKEHLIRTSAALPHWVELVLLPILNLLAALVISGAVIALMGESPWEAFKLMAGGALGSQEGWGYTLYYATNFIFTGLAVAIAYHAGLFNIGAEGQAYIGGLGVGLVCLGLGGWPFWVVLPVAMLAGALFGAAWAFIPAWLQARRGSHVVITTIMFNFIASALMTYLLVNVLIKPGQQSPETREFAASSFMPAMHELLAKVGLNFSVTPLNLAFFLALGASILVWILLWRTRWGFALRVAGQNPRAAVYAGISPSRVTIGAMLLSGALAGCLGLNELMGAQHRILIDFPGGAGFVGIAVALMGRNHPAGIIAGALLFGALQQGGSQLSFDMPRVNRDMVVVIQGLVILLCGALPNLFKAPVACAWTLIGGKRAAKEAEDR